MCVCVVCVVCVCVCVCVKGELEDGLPEEEEEEEVGQAEVLKVYRLRGDKAATIGGSVVRQGKVMRSGIFRVFRQGKVRERSG